MYNNIIHINILIGSNVLPLCFKQNLPPIIWIFIKCEGDGIESRLPFKILSTLHIWISLEVRIPLDICLFDLHPEEWFEGYPVNSTQIFTECLPDFFFWFISMPTKHFSGSLPEKNLGRFYRVEVHCTGYSSNQFSGYRLMPYPFSHFYFDLLFWI